MRAKSRGGSLKNGERATCTALLATAHNSMRRWASEQADLYAELLPAVLPDVASGDDDERTGERRSA